MSDTFDQTLANREGWGLFDDGEIQYLVDGVCDETGEPCGPPAFTSDAEAETFVAMLATAGSLYHREALEWHKRAALTQSTDDPSSCPFCRAEVMFVDEHLFKDGDETAKMDVFQCSSATCGKHFYV